MDDRLPDSTPLPRANAHELIVGRREDVVTVTLRVDPRIEEFVSRSWHNGEPLTPRVLMELDLQARRAVIFPTITYRHGDLYRPKYEQIQEIIFDMPAHAEAPEDGDDAQSLIKDLMPPGFMLEAEYGLGFVTLMKPVLYAVEELNGVQRICISRFEETRVEFDTFYFNSAEYRNLADVMHRITRQYQDESLKDRRLTAYNSVLHRVLPEEYAESRDLTRAAQSSDFLAGQTLKKQS